MVVSHLGTTLEFQSDHESLQTMGKKGNYMHAHRNAGKGLHLGKDNFLVPIKDHKSIISHVHMTLLKIGK